MASSAAKVVPASRCERPAPEPLWTRNFVAGTFLNFFIAGNYFMLMVVMTAYALTVHQAPAAVAAFCASAPYVVISPYGISHNNFQIIF